MTRSVWVTLLFVMLLLGGCRTTAGDSTVPVDGGGVGVPEAGAPSAKSHADMDAGQTDKWQLDAMLYLWTAGLSGSTTVQDDTVPINVKFGDVLDQFAGGGSLMFEGRKGEWGFFTDLTYISLEGDSDAPTGMGEIETQTTLGLVEVDATYTPPGLSSLTFLAGIRVVDIEQEVEFPVAPKFESGVTLVDPILGAQGTWRLGEDWWFRLRGDVGGFGVGSELTYQVLAAFRWSFAEGWGLNFGPRIMSYRIDDDDLQMDLTIQGLLLGLNYSF